VTLKAATNANSCRIDGLEVTACIMAINFRNLTGIETDTEALREALDEFLDY
jgi:indole-3-glycerol phosphate synthase